MHKSYFVAIALLLASTGVNAEVSGIQCTKGLKMFVSRGMGEPMGLGVTGLLTKIIAGIIPDSDEEAILYPASNVDPDYMVSVANGTELVKESVMKYTEACPDSKIAVFGYSQGAQNTANSFCGMPPFWAIGYGAGSDVDLGELQSKAAPLSKEAVKNVIAVILFGDTTRVASASFNYGTTKNSGNGLFFRDDIQACEAIGSRIRSYCDAGDPYCDVGQFLNTTAHMYYVPRYGEEIVEFVVNQFRKHRH